MRAAKREEMFDKWETLASHLMPVEVPKREVAVRDEVEVHIIGVDFNKEEGKKNEGQIMALKFQVAYQLPDHPQNFNQITG